MKLWEDTANQLKGSARRKFMAQVVDSSGRSGQVFAQDHLGWSRSTIQKGAIELATG
ncbi:hypothetical protein [Pelagibaculum spongiae]|uniref:hypothetical protein n=1 Tax=Pelagibaculum spongiae TaxID=2080658 RepID=UPI001314062A|nr:hypothetical protein [Pelagibaculum spongiae]